ncbi:MAG: hypothetical protein ACRBB6_11075 [Neptuniibacter sp.]
MENEYRPFFSRKQLTVLMWFSLLAILVLSSLGPGDVEYQKIQHNDAKSIYWMELDDQLNTLTLLLPSQPSLTQSQQRLQQLKAQVLLQRLKTHKNTAFTYNVYPRQDRIELSLTWASDGDLPNISELLFRLKQPVEANRWQEVLKTLEARDYLDNKAKEEQVIQQFFSHLQSDTANTLTALTTSYANLFDGVKYVISGDSAEDIAKNISETIVVSNSGNEGKTLTTTPTNVSLQADTTSKYVFLTGTVIPPRTDSSFVSHRLTAQVLQDLLSAHKEQYKIDYRILWAALKNTGYQAVIIKADQSPEAILPQLQQLITDELVESSQNQLAYLWQERMRDLQNQTHAMNLIAFYDLPHTTMEDYVEQIQDQDIEDIIILARQALKTDQHINILLTPSY